MTDETKAVVPMPEAGEVAVGNSLLAEMAECAGAGSENVTADAMAIPFIALAQAKTPQVEADPDNYKPGMLIHSITGKTYDIRERGGKPLRALLCHFNKQIVEWGDKEKGNGGLKSRHECTPARLAALEKLPRNDKGKPLAPNGTGNILEETAYHFFLLMPEDGDLDVAVLPLKSTGLTPSKKLIRMLDSRPVKVVPGRKPFKLPFFATVITIQSFLDKQKTGAQNTFQNVRFGLAEELTDTGAFLAAKAFYESVKGGTAVLDDAAEAGTTADAHVDHGSNDADTFGDDNVPF